MSSTDDWRSFSVCMGLDAMRLCLGMPPRNFSRDEVVAWIDAIQSVSENPRVTQTYEHGLQESKE